MKKITDIKNIFASQEVFAVYADCMYMPTWDKFLVRANEFVTDDSVHIFGYIEEDAVVGIIAVQQKENFCAEIKGIAVAPSHRKKGIGKQLIDSVFQHLPISALHAETDDDAIAFYQHCGFETESYMRQFESGSVRRYKCVLRKANRLQQIRQSERDSHMEIYASKDLYESGSWLQKPIKTVLDLIPIFQNYQELRILDLGCGVGRNCISLAQAYPNIPCAIDCVDILDFAIEKLQENAQKYNVTDAINGIVAPIEDFAIAPNRYDLIMAISALEHIDSETSFVHKLYEMQEGIRKNGIVCLVINSNVIEKNIETGALVPPQFEVNLSTEYLQALLNNIFHNWEPIKVTVRPQQYDIPRDGFVSDLSTDVVTFVAKK